MISESANWRCNVFSEDDLVRGLTFIAFLAWCLAVILVNSWSGSREQHILKAAMTRFKFLCGVGALLLGALLFYLPSSLMFRSLDELRSFEEVVKYNRELSMSLDSIKRVVEVILLMLLSGLMSVYNLIRIVVKYYGEDRLSVEPESRPTSHST